MPGRNIEARDRSTAGETALITKMDRVVGSPNGWSGARWTSCLHDLMDTEEFERLAWLSNFLNAKLVPITGCLKKKVVS